MAGTLNVTNFDDNNDSTPFRAMPFMEVVRYVLQSLLKHIEMKRQIDIPLVQQDLSHEETILQIALSLEKLEKVVSGLFANINGDIAKQNKQLEDIRARCGAARRKVDKLTGIDKSIQVFSSSKFPGPTPPTFYPLREIGIEETKRDIRIPFTPLPQDKLSMNEKLKFYHIKDNTLHLRKNESMTPSEGLGDIPQGIKTVNNLLLFNTKQNLYSQYKILDPLAPAQKHVVVEEKDTRPSISAAPLSLASGLDAQPTLRDYFYAPSLQDVPDIDAPANLPNLTGIAGDLRFGEDDQIDFPRKSRVIEEVKEEVVVKETTEVPQVKELPTKQVESVEKKVEVVIPPPPPPPPPLPPPDMETPSSAPVPKPRTEVPKQAPVADSRAELMAAIRQAGGSGKARLRSVAQETSPAPVGAGKPGNFMEDLHAKLSMRRKGISGKVDNSEGPSAGMLGRINSMIPPPPPKEPDSAGDDGSDWDE